MATVIQVGEGLLSAAGRAVRAAARPRVVVGSAGLAAVVAALAAVAQAEAGDEMRTKEFLSKLDHDRIVRAIQEAEAKTSGQIRAYIQRGHLNNDALPLAQKKFRRLKMDKTRDRNAVLIFIAPRARKFAVIGDQAIHQKCGEEFWQRVVDSMRAQFQKEKFTDAIVEAIEEVGKLLTTHFPKTSDRTNELSDEVIEG